jgi:hypothetical protein
MKLTMSTEEDLIKTSPKEPEWDGKVKVAGRRKEVRSVHFKDKEVKTPEYYEVVNFIYDPERESVLNVIDTVMAEQATAEASGENIKTYVNGTWWSEAMVGLQQDIHSIKNDAAKVLEGGDPVKEKTIA